MLQNLVVGRHEKVALGRLLDPTVPGGIWPEGRTISVTPEPHWAAPGDLFVPEDHAA